jgi:hypothetical protein
MFRSDRNSGRRPVSRLRLWQVSRRGPLGSGCYCEH